MVGETDPSDESRLTTDHDTVREWAADHDAMPVRRTGANDTSHLTLVPASAETETDQRVGWDEFFESVEDAGKVVVYHGTGGRRTFEVLDRDKAVGRATIESEAVEETLLEGEVVTSEVTETTVVERTVVEEATIESEVVDREVLEESIVGAERLSMDVRDCSVTDLEADSTEPINAARFTTGQRGPIEADVAVDVDEDWSLTREILERLTIESRIADVEAGETETVEADTLEGRVDMAGVQETVLSSDLVDTAASPAETVAQETVRSEFTEGDTVHTYVMERKTVEEELHRRRRLTGTLAEGETTGTESIRRSVLSSDLVAEDEAAAGATDGEAATHPRITDADEGKAVVDAAGEEVGMVVEVEGDTLYVDPHPSLTDRIKAALDWGEMDEDVYPIGPEQIGRVTEDRIELAVQE